MDILDSGKRHRRRGRQSRRKHQATFDRLAPGRAPIGIPSGQSVSFSIGSPALLPLPTTSTTGPTPTRTSQSVVEYQASKIEEQTVSNFSYPIEINSQSYERPEITVMSGFGAMARQAEYLAATNAKSRQASREAEEQMLPPKHVPISLSAFTKNQQPSRNKGAKAWKPLTLDDIGEGLSDQIADDREQESPTPSTEMRRVREAEPPSRNQTRILLRDSREVIKINLPPSSVPTGPRTVTDPQDRSTFLVHPVPHRILQHPINPPTAPAAPNLEVASVLMHNGGFPHPNCYLSYPYPVFSYSPGFNFADSPRSHNWQTTYGFHGVLAPSDISPTKQEEKFAMLSKLEAQSETQFQNLQQRQTYYNPHSDFLSEDETDHGWNQSLGGVFRSGRSEHNIQTVGGYDSSRMLPESKDEHCTTISTNISSEFGKRISMAHNIPAKVPLTLESRPVVQLEKPANHKSEDPSEIPYDRRTEMQSYISTTTQEAMARKTKTVLHNPELHKQQIHTRGAFGHLAVFSDPQQIRQTSQSTYPSLPWDIKARPMKSASIVPWEVMPPAASNRDIISKLNIPDGLSFDQPEHIARAINNPAPGLTLPDLNRSVEPDKETVQSEESFGRPVVGSDEWCEWKTPTRASREIVRKLMAKAAAKETNSTWGPPFSSYEVDSGNSCSSPAEVWFNKDKRGVRARAWEHAEQVTTKARGEAVNLSEGVLFPTTNFALNLLVIEARMNVQNYFERRQSVQEQRGNFFKTKPVPEYAIERGGLLTGTKQGFSFFDDDQDGFGIAPVRIARDPRFRLHGKDGSKMKLEDEWKHRHEMYERKFSDGWKCP